MKRPSGPHKPVALFFGSCRSLEMGLFIWFLCKTRLSAVVTVWSVPDIAVRILSEYALSYLGFVTFFVKVKGIVTNSFGSLLGFHR